MGNKRPGIYLINADGSNDTRIHAHGFAAQPSWSPDGDRLVFHRYHGGALDLYSINADGSGLLQLTDLKDEALNPIWSPMP